MARGKRLIAGAGCGLLCALGGVSRLRVSSLTS